MCWVALPVKTKILSGCRFCNVSGILRYSFRDYSMTIPAERTLAVLRTLDFLYSIEGRQDVPADVRDTARYLARHFPRSGDIKMTAQVMAHPSNRLGIVTFCVDDEFLGESLADEYKKTRKYDSR